MTSLGRSITRVYHTGTHTKGLITPNNRILGTVVHGQTVVSLKGVHLSLNAQGSNDGIITSGFKIEGAEDEGPGSSKRLK